MKKISVVIPIYNEEQSLHLLYARLVKVISVIDTYKFEMFFVNDGSEDNSMSIIKMFAVDDSRVTFLSLSRNYGKEIAMAAALDYVTGDAVVIMDADLQDPPELISEMIKEWENGYDDVYGKRMLRNGETWFKKTTSHLYYNILQKCTRIPIQKDTGDFRLLSRRAIESIKRLRENQRYTKGLFSWIGFKKKEITFYREARVAGNTKWNYLQLIELAIEGITSLTIAPLRLASIVGFFTGVSAVSYLLYIVGRSILYDVPIADYSFLMIVMLFLGGMQLLSIGIIGEYLGRVFNETKNRPLYFVDEYSGDK